MDGGVAWCGWRSAVETNSTRNGWWSSMVCGGALCERVCGKLLELAERCSLYRPTLPKAVSGDIFHRVFSGVSFDLSLRKATESG